MLTQRERFWLAFDKSYQLRREMEVLERKLAVLRRKLNLNEKKVEALDNRDLLQRFVYDEDFLPPSSSHAVFNYFGERFHYLTPETTVMAMLVSMLKFGPPSSPHSSHLHLAGCRRAVYHFFVFVYGGHGPVPYGVTFSEADFDDAAENNTFENGYSQPMILANSVRIFCMLHLWCERARKSVQELNT